MLFLAEAQHGQGHGAWKCQEPRFQPAISGILPQGPPDRQEAA